MKHGTHWRTGSLYGLIAGLLVLLLSGCAGDAPAAPEVPGVSEQAEANIASEQGGQGDIVPAVTATVPPDEDADADAGDAPADADAEDEDMTETPDADAENGDTADEDGIDAGADMLAGTTWQWTALTGATEENLTVESPQNYTLEFGEDGGMAMQVDCNRATGTYTLIDEETLDIEIGPVTLVACGPDSLDAAYLRLIAATDTFMIEDDTLLVNLDDDGGTLEFAPVSTPDAGEETAETAEAE